MLDKNYKKQLFIILIMLWICLIFSFSLRDGETSTAMSDKVGQVMIENSSSEVSEKFDEMSWYELKLFNQAIRKCAHFTEFFILGVLMYLTLRQTTIVHKAGIGLVLCMLVAAMDETIQLFMDGRLGQLTDVLLDSCGGLVGIWMAYLIASRVKSGVKRRI